MKWTSLRKPFTKCKREREKTRIHLYLISLSPFLSRKSPNSDYALENENLRVVIESLQKSLKSLDGEVELHKLKLKERNSELDLQKE